MCCPFPETNKLPLWKTRLLFLIRESCGARCERSPLPRLSPPIFSREGLAGAGPGAADGAAAVAGGRRQGAAASPSARLPQRGPLGPGPPAAGSGPGEAVREKAGPRAAFAQIRIFFCRPVR